ncbi:MAG: DUF1501 domain-containing protein [Armatimonas sp.]
MDRRGFLLQAGAGLSAVALPYLLQSEALAAAPVGKAKRVIFVFCCGGVSHIDTFDYKPELKKREGQELTGKGKLDTFFAQPGKLMGSPFEFRQHGQSGAWVSSLLPNIAEHVDDMTFIHSMVSKSSNHTPATFFFNTGFTMNGFPCLGAWLSYGLGSLNENLPSFVVLPDPRGLPAGGPINWTSGFLPASHQGVAFQTKGDLIPELFPADPEAQKKLAGRLAFLQKLNREDEAAHPGDSTLSARIRSYELAARMQVSIPEAAGIEKESEATKALYGLDRETTAGFGRNCLLARRLVERGVRFVQLFHGGAFGGSPRINWDGHEDMVDNHTRQAENLDKPLAGLLTDLKQRGLLDDTLVVCATEFGRTPFTQGVGTRGRDHHPHAFTIWMAGAGVKKGLHYGTSDEVGYNAVENPVEVYDLNATILQLLGIDHKQLTYYHNGIRRRLTDVHGTVVNALLA